LCDVRNGSKADIRPKGLSSQSHPTEEANPSHHVDSALSIEFLVTVKVSLKRFQMHAFRRGCRSNG